MQHRKENLFVEFKAGILMLPATKEIKSKDI